MTGQDWTRESDRELLARWRVRPSGVIGIGRDGQGYWERVALLESELRRRGLL